MYQHNLIVRWSNGDLEGFSATAFLGKNAYDQALAKADKKAKVIGATYKEIKSWNTLNKAEKQAMRQDWQMSIKNEGEFS